MNRIHQYPVHVILARDSNDGIGLNGRIPWTSPGDMKFFKRTTSTRNDPEHKNLVVVGCRTLASMPKRLPNRYMTTMDRQGHFDIPDDTGTIFLGGGCASLRAYFSRCERWDAPWPQTMFLSRIEGDYECDTRVTDEDLRLHRYTKSTTRQRDGWSVDVYTLA